jgi:prepilin-type N-terminal cleavage/methylation domain-containing protein
MNCLQKENTRRNKAFTLIETVVAMSMVSIMGVALYSGLSSGFAVVNMARQNLRATQIALEKMETMRMYSWDQVNSNGFVPVNFTAPFFPTPGNTNDNGGLTYYGTTVITNVGLNTTYTNSLRMALVRITWTNGAIAYNREFSTYISQYGMQRYIY